MAGLNVCVRFLISFLYYFRILDLGKFSALPQEQMSFNLMFTARSNVCDFCLSSNGCFSLNLGKEIGRVSLLEADKSSPSLAAVHLCREEAGVFTVLVPVADGFCFT